MASGFDPDGERTGPLVVLIYFIHLFRVVYFCNSWRSSISTSSTACRNCVQKLKRDKYLLVLSTRAQMTLS